MFSKGDDVVVRFVGRDHRGEVVSDHNGSLPDNIIEMLTAGGMMLG